MTLSPRQVSKRKRILRAVFVIVPMAVIVAFFPAWSNEQAQSEVSDTLLHFIVEQEIGGTASYIQSSGQPWVDSPPKANLIIWSSVRNTERYNIQIDEESPLRVWWYSENRLLEATDGPASIQKYRDQYMSSPQSNIWAWGYYEFGIWPNSTFGPITQVYVGASCGPLCGHGFRYTLVRILGQWYIIGGEHLWQS